ncbi:TIGR01212 family radical SAM protein [Carboxylicivirga linearis]|nr:TIGR01212 family radical SAM protein [Carboxylicivirga linearis]
MEFPWGHNKRYNDYSSYIKQTFGERVQKLSVNAGFTCPNRDGTKGVGGCAFCNNSTFNPAYCGPEKTITEQLEQGISFFQPKYKTMQYLAYFQAYSNTYGETQELLKLYKEALDHPLVKGLVLGTRPDCISDDLLEHLAEWQKEYYIAIELGAESTLESTLVDINRGHTYAETVETTKRIVAHNIPVGIHLILGLPGELKEDMLLHATEISKLPINFLKLHQLQIVKGSAFAKQFKNNPESFNLYSAENYIELVVDFIERLNPEIVLERFISQAPHELLIAPRWGLKNFEFVAKVEKRLKERDTWQGKLFGKPSE